MLNNIVSDFSGIHLFWKVLEIVMVGASTLGFLIMAIHCSKLPKEERTGIMQVKYSVIYGIFVLLLYIALVCLNTQFVNQ